jgi:hypothetical protein
MRLNEECQNLGNEDCVEVEVADLNILRTRQIEVCQKLGTVDGVEVELSVLMI